MFIREIGVIGGCLKRMTRIAILGSTGSIGTSALDVARTHADRIEVVAIAAATNVAAMAKQVLEFRPRAVGMATGDAMDQLRAVLGGSPAELCGVGNDGLIEMATHPDVDVVLCASSGTAALDAVLAAMQALVNRIVLAVHRQHGHTLAAGGVHDDATGHDEYFLVRQRNGLARLDGRQHRIERGRAG